MDKPERRAVSQPWMKRSGVHGKSLPQVSASRRYASVVDAMSCTIESSLRDSIIIYHCQSGHSASLHNRLLSVRPDGLREDREIPGNWMANYPSTCMAPSARIRRRTGNWMANYPSPCREALSARIRRQWGRNICRVKKQPREVTSQGCED
jgi:hypothetical protein